MKPEQLHENQELQIQHSNGIRNLIHKDPNPTLLKSEFNSGFIYSRIRIGFVFLLFISYYGYRMGFNIGSAIPILIFLIFLFLYLNFTLGHLYIWEFKENYFTRQHLIKRGKKTYPYRQISSWQERMRFGTQSREESIPNYHETAIWMKNKEALTFDEIDFSNFDKMNAFFIQKCDQFQIEMAEYRD